MKFLGRAKKFLQDLSNESDPRVQYFNVACASGHRIRGERTEGYQALRCPVCGDGIFVLPRSPLPEPVAPPTAAPIRQPDTVARAADDGPIALADASHMAVDFDDRHAAASHVEIDWENDPGPRKPVRSSPGNSAVVAPPHGVGEEELATAGVANASSVGTHTPSRTTSRSKQRPVAPNPTPGQRLESRRDRAVRLLGTLKRRRHQLIFAAVPLLVVAAVGWRVWNNRRQEYPITIERGKTEGIPALDEGNFDKAYQLLSAAKSAVDALGGEIEGADMVRQAANEAAIFVDQCSQSLEDMLEEAGRTSPDAWASKFDSFYKGKGIILDSWILSAPPPGSTKPYQLTYKVFPPGQPGNFRDETGSRPDRYADIDLTDFDLFGTGRQAGEQVTFGARLASFRYDIERNRWLIGLEPHSGVYIQHTKALDASGWAEDASSTQTTEARP